MLSEYDTDLTLAIGRQRAAELRAEADRERLARAMRRDSGEMPWWRRLGRRRGGRHAAAAGIAPVLRWP